MNQTVKINVGYDERSNTFYYTKFRIEEELPAAGDFYDGKEVVSVKPMEKDCEQPNFNAREYDCFCVSVKDDDGDIEERYIALSNLERNHRGMIVRFRTLCPTINEANILLSHALSDSFYYKEEMTDIERECLIQEYFGISPEQFEDALVYASGVRIGTGTMVKGEGDSVCRGSVMAAPGEVSLWGDVPYWWKNNTDTLCVSVEDARELFRSGERVSRERSVRDLHPDIFAQIVSCCDEIGPSWFAEEGYPAWFNLISLYPQEIMDISELITDVCCGPFLNIIKKAGCSQADFCRRLFIGKSTLRAWISGQNPCKIYLRLLIAEKLGVIERR